MAFAVALGLAWVLATPGRAGLPRPCSGRPRREAPPLQQETGAAEGQERAGSPAVNGRATRMREVTDEVGRRVRVPAFPERIVALAPNLTETLYALGVEGRLVGVTAYADHPAAAQTKPHVGQPMNPSLEEIAALHPDLILATPTINRLETVEALDRLGLAVYATDPHSVEGLLQSMARVATLVGATAAGERLVAEQQARLDRLRERLAGRPAKRVLFVVWTDPLITAGEHSFIADALRRAGAESVVTARRFPPAAGYRREVTSREDWPHISLEEVVALEPSDLIFASSHSGAEKEIAEELGKRPGWRDLEAVREGHIVVVSDAINRPGPCLVGAIEELARQLHPEAFVPSSASRVRAGQEEALCGR
jgi:cobalamin transport system substrate-binding protein